MVNALNRILLVEDNEADVRLIKETLQSPFCFIEVAIDMEEMASKTKE